MIGMLVFEEFFQHSYWFWIAGNFLSDAVNLVDIVVQSKRGGRRKEAKRSQEKRSEFLLGGIPIRESKEIRKHYVKRWASLQPANPGSQDIGALLAL